MQKGGKMSLKMGGCLPEQWGPWATGADGSQLVYILAAGGFVKTGRSKDVTKRIQQLQGGCPHKIEPVVGVGPFDMAIANSIETDLLRAMRPTRTHGEWFDCGVEQAVALVFYYCTYYSGARYYTFNGQYDSVALACAEREGTIRNTLLSKEERDAAWDEVRKLISPFCIAW
jgi:hypothetical protein